MAVRRAWFRAFDTAAQATQSNVHSALAQVGIDLDASSCAQGSPGIVYFSTFDDDLLQVLRECGRAGAPVLALASSPEVVPPAGVWRLLQAGARDALVWSGDGRESAQQILARVERWAEVETLAVRAAQSLGIIGASAGWRDFIRRVVEAARFTQAPILLIGESGTGKEMIARLIHAMDRRSANLSAPTNEPVTVDCSTIVAELSGSEFFGHEKGAFTGAVGPREGAFALADDGTLFLDEVGELPITMQGQLLRVVQEKTYKRVGGNVWQNTDFRLVSATNRDLEQMVSRGQFRLDLYHRLSGWVFRLPPLRERREDILPLASYFIETLHPDEDPLEFDDTVRQYLLNRDYPGNIRELSQLVQRISHRHVGPGPITAGDIPCEDRPADALAPSAWPDNRLELLIEDAITLGVGLKEISQATTEAAIRIAVQSEQGNLQRAARRLGVTDRALQLRRAAKKAAG